MTLLSFVIPCYRSEKTIGMVIDEIIQTVQQREGYDYEIICVNDGSPDGVYDVLKKIATKNQRIKVIDLTKNMGKHSAVMAGYSVVQGDYIISLDDDYQCPMGELWNLLKPLEQDGYDMTSAVYRKKMESPWKRFGSLMNVKMAEFIIGRPKGISVENFFALKRYVVDQVVKYPYPYPYLSGLIIRVTHRIQMVEMDERERADENPSGFTLKKSIGLFFNGFTAFSVTPLRLATLSGFFFAFLGMLLMIYYIVQKLMHPEIIMGYSSIVSILLFSTGSIMIMLGIIGEYIGRIYICINKAPQYVIRDTMNLVKGGER